MFKPDILFLTKICKRSYLQANKNNGANQVHRIIADLCFQSHQDHCTGRLMVNTAPLSFATFTSPPCAVIYCLTIASPRPVPFAFFFVTKGSNRVLILSLGIPSPLSRMVITTWFIFLSISAEISILGLAILWSINTSIALFTKFMTDRFSLLSSPGTVISAEIFLQMAT